MLGLLGGLLGGGMMRRAMAPKPMMRRSPLAGLIANRISSGRSGGGGGGSSSVSSAPQMNSQEQPPEEQPQQEQQQQVQPQQDTAQHTEVQPRPFVQTASQGIEKQDEQRQQAAEGQPQPAKPVTAELLEPGPAAPTQTPRLGTDAVPQQESVVNQTEASSPVVTPEKSQFGNIPEVGVPGIEGRMDEAPPRHQFAQEDPNPTQPLQLTQSAYTGNAPPYRYQSAGSATAFAPQYSYRRR
jgi:hypothetical protein